MRVARSGGATNMQSLFNRRREELGLSCARLAALAGLSLRTVQRVMSGEEADPGFGTVAAIAGCLGISLKWEGEDAEVIRRKRAEEKADHLLAIVQGTMGLEAQAVGDGAAAALRERTIHELLAGSPRRLWED